MLIMKKMNSNVKMAKHIKENSLKIKSINKRKTR